MPARSLGSKTMKGADNNKNYFVSSAKLFNFMKKTFGNGNIVLYQSDGGANGTLFQSKLAGHKGIYIMQANYPNQFRALGHRTLFDGVDCIGGHNYFNATGGVAQITLWILTN
jgi:hypothetical protein